VGPTHAKQLVQKMKDVLPNFQINIASTAVKRRGRFYHKAHCEI
jgi:hypothetical protein